MGRTKKPPADPKATTTIRRAPAKTMDEQIERNIYLATIAAEKQLSDGTAAAPVITHYLQLGSKKYELEIERLRHENALLEAKKKQIESTAKQEELFTKAIEAMKTYGGSRSDTPID